MSTPYQQYASTIIKIADLKYASAVLQWDQETYLPTLGGHFRARQLATLNEVAHEMFVAPTTGDIIKKALEDPSLTVRQKRNTELSLEDFERGIKLPSSFVRTMSETISQSFHAWMDARKHRDFSRFRDDLQKVIELKKQEADMLGYEGHPYNALMNDYDKGLTTATVDKLFDGLRTHLQPLLNKIAAAPAPDDSMLRGHFPKDRQWILGMELLRHLHFNFDAGRQDISEHPFSTAFSPHDVRITTRIDEKDFANMIWSCIHECGHALYEQGLPADEYGLPLGEYCSLSIHESQSRLWENNIGRSLPFWKGHYSIIQNNFPEVFENITVEKFYSAINKVQPSLIRTEADEITYHFHIMIRYELEKELIAGTLNADDVPSFWNEKYKSYLGVDVPDDLLGCLQDVHWSHGSFGYFPTYSIGSLYAAQFFNAITLKNPEWKNEFAAGNTQQVISWLRQYIYPHGRYYSSENLCKFVTGESLNENHFLQYVREKYKAVYALSLP